MQKPKLPSPQRLRRIAAEINALADSLAGASGDSPGAARPPANSLGARIAAARIASGMSQIDAAVSLGMSPAQLCLLEKDKVSPTVRTVLLVARTLGVSPGRLLDGLEVPNA